MKAAKDGNACHESLVRTFSATFQAYDSSLKLKAGWFESFLDDFNSAYASARESRAETTPHLDILRVFGLGSREACHSRAFAWFIRGDAEHEQGALFANALLKLVNLPPVATENYHVLLERPERVDIAIYAAKEFAIFIENKVYAGEQKTQFERLMDALKRFSEIKGVPSGRRVALFMTNDGRSPSTGPANPDRSIAVFSFRRDQIIRAFSEALLTSKRKSALLESLLKAYENCAASLT